MRSTYLFACIVACAACSSSTPSQPTPKSDAGIVDAAKDATDSGNVTPDAGPTCGKECDGIAVQNFYAGDSTHDFTVTADAWKDYGDDVDGKTTTSSSNDVCQRASGAPSSSQTDGTAGIDNSFGAGFIPLVQSLTGNPDLSLTGTTAIGKGKASTSLFVIDGTGTGTAKTRFFSGLPLGKTPLFDGTDEWPVADESVTDGDLQKPISLFPASTLDGTTFDTGPNATGPSGSVLVQIEISTFRIPIRKMRVRGTVTADGVTNGIISGVIRTDELIGEMKRVLGTVNTSFCQGSQLAAITQQIKQLQDIMDDGTQDSSKSCNAVSVGLGFDGKKIRLGAVTPTPTTPNPCQ
ncbi:hypothetical protein BH09MYX1_BH09MYX1_20920 [soil metagenome]